MNARLLRSEVRVAGGRWSPGPACSPNRAQEGWRGWGAGHLLQPLKAAVFWTVTKLLLKLCALAIGQFSNLQRCLYDYTDIKNFYHIIPGLEPIHAERVAL